jgi:hypothetical protein
MVSACHSERKRRRGISPWLSCPERVISRRYAKVSPRSTLSGHESLGRISRGVGGFGFPVFEQDGNFSKTHFAIQKIFGK